MSGLDTTPRIELKSRVFDGLDEVRDILAGMIRKRRDLGDELQARAASVTGHAVVESMVALKLCDESVGQLATALAVLQARRP